MTWRIQYAGLCGGILAMLLLGACSPHEFPTSEGGDPGKDFSVRLQFVDDLPVLRTISADTKASAQAGAYRYSVELLRYVDDVAYKLTAPRPRPRLGGGVGCVAGCRRRGGLRGVGCRVCLGG